MPRNVCPKTTGTALPTALGAHPAPPPQQLTLISLFSLAVAIVNLPFSKFNKKLIGEKKRKKKGHFIPNNKRPIDFSIF